MVYYVAFHTIHMNIAKLYMTVITFHIKISVISTKFCPERNLQYVAEAKRSDNIINTVRTDTVPAALKQINKCIRLSLSLLYDCVHMDQVYTANNKE